MRKQLRKLAVMGVAVLSGTMVFASGAQAQTTYNVGVGAFLGQDVPAEEMKFLPDRIQVHQGDTLHFTSESFHTATLLPVGTDPSDWIAENASEVGDPFFLAQPDPDDGPASAKYNFGVLLPTLMDCGQSGAPACDHDGTGVLNSGVPLDGPMDFSVNVGAAPGTAFWALCLIHPSMKMRVQVVDNAAPKSEQSAIDSQVAEQLENDHTDALALHNKLKDKRSFHRTSTGRKIWDAWAGFDTKRFSLLDMYPNKLTIKKGQRVQWHYSQLIHEPHSASINKKQAIARVVSQDFAFGCDPDGDAGTAPDNPPELEGFPFCNDPSQQEVDVADGFFPPAGNGKYTGGSDFEHSGVRGAIPLASTDDPFTVRFTKVTNRKGTGYICVIHPFMQGRVRVKG